MNISSNVLIGGGAIALLLIAVLAATHWADDDDYQYKDNRDAEVIDFVDNAVAAHGEQGAAVFAEFSDPTNSEWVIDDDLYVVVIDKAARTVVANGGIPSLVGVSIDSPELSLELRANAEALIYQSDEMPDGVWTHYAHINPLGKRERYQVKRAYLMTSGDLVFLAGRYLKRGH